MSCENCGKKNNKRGFFKNFVTKYHTFIFTLHFIPNFRVFLRLLRGYLRVNILGKDQIRLVEIFVTLDCNARCHFCSNGLFTKKKGDLTFEKYIEIIDECAKLNVPVVCLIGGEPLLYNRLNELIQRINKHGMISMISTNGSLLTENKIKELKMRGLSSIAISLHSMNEAAHDAVLKIPGAYKRAFQAKDYCDKYGINFLMASVVLHSDFVNSGFDKLVNFVSEKKIPLSINPIIPTGYANTEKDELLTFDDVQKLNKISAESNYVSTHLTNNFFGFGCPAGNGYVGVNVTGEMFPCFFIPVSLGNVKEMSLKEAWEKACKSPLFTKKHKMCYAGTSREFVKDYMDPIFKFENVPIPIESHPKYDKKIGGLEDLSISDIKEAILDKI